MTSVKMTLRLTGIFGEVLEYLKLKILTFFK